MNHRRILKYSLIPGALTFVLMPKDAKVLCVQVQNECPMIWVLADIKKPEEGRCFWAMPMGHEFDTDEVGEYIGTYQLSGGTFVYHVFEGKGDRHGP